MPMTIATTAEDKTHPMDAGVTTTEWAGAKLVTWLAGGIAIAGTILTLVEGITQVLPPDLGRVGQYIAIGGAAIAGLQQVAYQIQRMLLKIAAIKYGNTLPPADPPPGAPVKAPDAAAANLGQ
jgi:hypothetical protein